MKKECRIMRTIIKVLFSLVFTFSLILSCEKIPDNGIWPPDESQDVERAVITKISSNFETMDPDSIPFAGVGIITIEGLNFSAVPAENRIFFDGVPGEVIEASATLLQARVANVVGDSVIVQLDTKNALEYAVYQGKDTAFVGKSYFPIKTKNAVPEYKAIDEFTDISGLAVDANDNVYALNLEKKVLKFTHPDSDAVEYGTTIFIVTGSGGLRFGPDSALYLTRTSKSIYKIPAGGGVKASKLISANTNVSHLDFDANGNLFAAGKGETIEVVLADGVTKATAADYTGYEITALRVFEDYVYVSGKSDPLDSLAIQEGIWKNQIIDANGNLGANELVSNWSEFAGEGGPSITAITFDEDGEMYIGQDKGEAIYLFNKQEYFYPQILKAPVTSLTWGNGHYLYINKHADEPTERTIIRVELTKNGAIYHGRN